MKEKTDLENHFDNCSKYVGWAEDMVQLCTKAKESASEAMARLVATRYEAHFVIIYRGTMKDADKRRDLFTDLNKWLADKGGDDADVILPVIKKFIMDSIEGKAKTQTK